MGDLECRRCGECGVVISMLLVILVIFFIFVVFVFVFFVEGWRMFYLRVLDCFCLMDCLFVGFINICRFFKERGVGMWNF